MSEDQICPIWGTPASVKPGNGDFDQVDSPRAGGKYRIARRAQIILRSEDDSIKARLTSWVIEQHQSGEDDPKITEHTLNDVKQRPPLPLKKRIDNLLTYIQQTVSQIGGTFTFSRGQNNRGSMKMLAWSESINIDEVKALMDHLEESGCLKKNLAPLKAISYSLTVEGHSRATEPEQTVAQEPKPHEPSDQPLTQIAEREQTAIGQGEVFDYFNKLRELIETATQDMLFVDPYLDADFVSHYLPYVKPGVSIRLLTREQLPKLLPAVDRFVQQHSGAVEVRSAPGFHDRYVFVDQNACYQSGASFKDGAKKAPTTLIQITDVFPAVLQTYKDMWDQAKVEWPQEQAR